MAALTSAQHAGLFMFLWIIGSVAAGETLEENAKPGENVLLQCNSPTHAAVTKLEWKRPELKDEYVFLFKNNKPFDNNQDPRYRGRVQLIDPEMKNGDASVVLKNVNIYDSGTYQCWVITSQTRRRRAADEKLVASVHLIVSERPEKEIKNEHLKNGHSNDEQPGGPRGYIRLVSWFVSLLLCSCCCRCWTCCEI
ncbi:hypothetical protein OYC64_001173 [Pagothenia borchgrevinki]|uniref:Ig-like domain-containing protein n=1 Tax=Pagothenia borchgrevinki TaxID=8213 RepID=A0ABD2GA40_PAGBO